METENIGDSLGKNSSKAQEFFNLGKERAEKRFTNIDVDDVMDRTWKVIDSLQYDEATGKRFMDYEPFELIQKAAELAMLKAYLGRHASWANLQTNNSYLYKKFQRAGKRSIATDTLNAKFKHDKIYHKEIAKKPTVDDITAELDKITLREEQDWVFNQAYADTAINLFKSLEWIMSSIRWRLQELESERKTSFTPETYPSN